MFFKSQENDNPIYSVWELTKELKTLVNQHFADVWVKGEISNFKTYASGHAYPTLKDEKAQIPCAIFKGVLDKLKFEVEDGMSVLAHGRIDVYQPRGTCQFIINHLEPDGIGALQLAFEQLKEKLSKEGLFEASRKKALPFLPTRIGVVTSLHGAAFHDICSTLQRRFPNIEIVIYPTAVQGEKASYEIAEAIDYFSQNQSVDVLIVGRGGGSLEDLWAFNEERVVRAIANCAIPVISAVGHETDFSLSDFAADLRAPTPTAAAELCVPEKRLLLLAIQEKQKQLYVSIQQLLRAKALTQQNLKKRIPLPQKIWQDWQQKLDFLQDRLYQGIVLFIRDRRFLFREYQIRLPSPTRFLNDCQKNVDILRKDLWQHFKIRFEKQKSKTAEAKLRLNLLSPHAVLKRGYLISRLQGKVISKVEDIALGQKLNLVYQDGDIEVTVDKILSKR